MGVRKICRSTVKNILKEAGLDPGPNRGEDSWDDFLKRHAATLWACDFFTKPVWTLCGWVEVYVLFFIYIGTRRVHIAGMTPNPDRAWIAQQARNTAMYFGQLPERPTMLLRDRDQKYSEQFDAVFKAEGVEVKRVGPQAPNMNAFAERWVQSVQKECLNHSLVFGEAHLRHILAEYVAHYYQERPHQGWGTGRSPGRTRRRRRRWTRGRSVRGATGRGSPRSRLSAASSFLVSTYRCRVRGIHECPFFARSVLHMKASVTSSA